MTEKHARIAEGASFEEVLALLSKVTRQLRSLEPPPHVVKELDRNEALIELMIARWERNLILH